MSDKRISDQQKSRHAALAARPPKIKAHNPVKDQDTIRFEDAKFTKLPASLAALGAERKKLARLRENIAERSDAAMRREATYPTSEKLADSRALEAAQLRVDDLEREVNHWAGIVSQHENGEMRREYDSIQHEAAEARALGLQHATKLFRTLKTLLRYLDAVTEQSMLHARVVRQGARLRTELLTAGEPVGFEVQQPFPCDPYRFGKFVGHELVKPERGRTKWEDYSRVFPLISFEQDAEADATMLAEESDDTAKPKACTKCTKQRRTKSKRKAKATKRTAKKPANVAKLQGKKPGRIRAKAA